MLINYSDILKGSVEVETASFRVVVSVLFDSQTSVFSQWDVISPGRSWQIEVFATREKSCQECCSNTQGAGTRDSLHCGILWCKEYKMNVLPYSLICKWMEKHTSPFLLHSLSSPKAKLIEALQNSGLPEIGEYSLSMFFFAISASACIKSRHKFRHIPNH